MSRGFIRRTRMSVESDSSVKFFKTLFTRSRVSTLFVMCISSGDTRETAVTPGAGEYSRIGVRVIIADIKGVAFHQVLIEILGICPSSVAYHTSPHPAAANSGVYGDAAVVFELGLAVEEVGTAGTRLREGAWSDTGFGLRDDGQSRSITFTR